MEFVYVVKRSDLFDLHFPQGLLLSRSSAEADRYLARCRRGFFVERRHAEEDSSLKQIIPYVLLRHADRVLLLRRSKRGGDARLHDKLSIGVGGHINPEDASSNDVIAACARREIAEELTVAAPPDLRPIGIINDDSNPVGAVHFGVVHVASTATADVAARETELLRAEWIGAEELLRLARDPASNLETWSRLIALSLADALA